METFINDVMERGERRSEASIGEYLDQQSVLGKKYYQNSNIKHIVN